MHRFTVFWRLFGFDFDFCLILRYFSAMVVRMRANRSKTGKRRSHHALTGVRLSTCECGALRISHRACPQCGKYNGHIVIDVVARTKREQRREKRRRKELQESGQVTGEAKEDAKT